MSCVGCLSHPRSLAVLICDHSVCMPCGALLLQLDTLNQRQKKFRLRCPHCQKVTLTYGIQNLVVSRSQGLPLSRRRQQPGLSVSMQNFSCQKPNIEGRLLRLLNILNKPNPGYGRNNRDSDQIKDKYENKREKVSEKVNQAKQLLQGHYNLMVEEINDMFSTMVKQLMDRKQGFLTELQSTFTSQFNNLQCYTDTLAKSDPSAPTYQLIKISRAINQMQSYEERFQSIRQQIVELTSKPVGMDQVEYQGGQASNTRNITIQMCSSYKGLEACVQSKVSRRFRL